MAEGGYSEKSLWGDAAWEWLRSSGTLHPAFWTRRGSQFFIRTMFDEVPLAPRLARLREPRGSLGLRALGGQGTAHAKPNGTAPRTARRNGAERAYPWGDEPPDAEPGNFDFQHWDPAPVAAFPAGSSAFGVTDLVGNGWEWTRTRFRALRRIRAVFVLSRLFREFFRRQALRHERRIGAHGGLHAAAVVSQLVSAALPIHLCGFPLRRALTRISSRSRTAMLTHAPAQYSVCRIRRGSASGFNAAGPERAPSKYLYDEVGSALFEVITALARVWAVPRR